MTLELLLVFTLLFELVELLFWRLIDDGVEEEDDDGRMGRLIRLIDSFDSVDCWYPAEECDLFKLDDDFVLEVELFDCLPDDDELLRDLEDDDDVEDDDFFFISLFDWLSVSLSCVDFIFVELLLLLLLFKEPVFLLVELFNDFECVPFVSFCFTFIFSL